MKQMSTTCRVMPSVRSTEKCSRILDQLGTSGEVQVMSGKQAAAVVMSMKAYSKVQNRILDLEAVLDHVLLFMELKFRDKEPKREISLADLRKRHRL
jgi:hypothetical protein